MRKGRNKYKRNERLGFNVILRRWSGKKKKWSGHVIEKTNQDTINDLERKQSRNPKVLITNTERIGGVNNNDDELDSQQMGISQQGPNVLRRKDIHGIYQNQKTGRKGRYGGIVCDTVTKGRSEQRKTYKVWKRTEDRDYRNGLLRGEDSIRNNEVDSKKQQIEVHRRAEMEIRVDVRRWRSGRVSTLQMGRDLIEHGKVSYVNVESSELNKKVEWQGAKLDIGMGRQVDEVVWKTRKQKVSSYMDKPENHVTAATYREVDYVTGIIVVLRYPESNEVAIPDGRNVSLSSYL